MPAIELEIEGEDVGERLDVFVARRVPDLSRARAKGLIEKGEVRVDGRRVKKSYALAAGDRVTLEDLPGPADFYAAPDPNVALEVVLETDRYVVVDKPAGVASHPLRQGELGTLAGALLARYPEMRGVGYRKREPGILHRLDTGTSGLMLAARDPGTFEELRRMLRDGEIEKRYLARCVGVVPAPSVIDKPIATDPRDRRKVRACTDPREVKRLGARAARTEVLRSTPAEQGSLVELRADSARRHQIRVHLASIGHPLLGDSLYGGPPLDHHLLHASYLRVGTLSISTSDWNYSFYTPKSATPED
ncbi:MAG: RluA family pseudouridine synthase [Myxococcales bacterium]|nr:RluA family pseudouridine synthase [Deltaproteobacteria bacterium]NNL24008.1 RluA family pseudouridine synthase [Myxococcales bacterium]